MITVEQWRILLGKIASMEQQHGTRERDGTIHEVWEQNGEQKARVRIGGTDEEPWLTGWMHIASDHRGPERSETKVRKGQNVKVQFTSGYNYSDGKIITSAENQEHQRPQHADSYQNTTQYAFSRYGQTGDFREWWLRKKEGQQQTTQKKSQEKITGQFSANDKIKPEEKDDVSKAIALIRIGKLPPKREKNKPWEGPSQRDGDPKPIVTIWAKTDSGGGGSQQTYALGAGTSGDGPPDVEAQEIHIQFGKLAKTVLSEGKVVHSVGELDAKGNLVNEAMAAITTIIGDRITHKVTDQTITTMMPNFIRHFSQRVDLKALQTLFASSDGVLHLHGAPIKVLPMILHPKDYSNPSGFAGAAHPFRDDDPDPTYITASMSGPAPPSDPENGVPFNGIRWTDTTSGIEYSYYDGVWSEGGGRVAFPAEPAVGDVHEFAGRRWRWNGVGWESLLPWSTQEEAEAGEVDDTVMSPLRVAQAIAALVTEFSPNWATQEEAEAGLVQGKFMDPLRTAQAIAALVDEFSPLWATQAEAEAGVAENKFMDPLRARQAIAALAGTMKIAGGTVADVASLTLSVDPATIGVFKGFTLRLSEVRPATDNVALWLRLGDADGIDSGASDYHYSDTSASAIAVGTGPGVGNAAGEGCDVVVHLPTNDAAAAGRNRVAISGAYTDYQGNLGATIAAGERAVHIDLTQVQVLFSSGNIASAAYSLIGIF